MFRRLHREARYVMGASAGLVVGAMVLTAGWFSPWSPAAIDRPAMTLAQGDAHGAIDAYIALADSLAPKATRQEAMWRAVYIASADLGDAERAIELCSAYLERFPRGAQRADVLAQRAALLASTGAPLAAAASWARAAEVAPKHPDVGAWLFESGFTYLNQDKPRRAAPLLMAAADHPDHAVAASLTLGRMFLGADPAKSYAWYERALQHKPDAESARLARLGQATALEKMDQQEQALAELELGMDDEDAALRLRRERLEARRDRDAKPSAPASFTNPTR